MNLERQIQHQATEARTDRLRNVLYNGKNNCPQKLSSSRPLQPRSFDELPSFQAMPSRKNARGSVALKKPYPKLSVSSSTMTAAPTRTPSPTKRELRRGSLKRPHSKTRNEEPLSSSTAKMHDLSTSSDLPVKPEHLTRHTYHQERPSFQNSLSSFDLSFSSYHRSSHSFASDQSGLRYSSVAGEQSWARFKLLGRLGLGDIRLSRRKQNLVQQNYATMLDAIKHIYALRDDVLGHASTSSLSLGRGPDVLTGEILVEIQEAIPIIVENPPKVKRDPDSIEVSPLIKAQLKDFITAIACMYRDNAFHNFEHASTVLKALEKLVHLVTPSDNNASYRYLRCVDGVATGPWTQFALTFAALIHDMDHSGVPNAQLIKEGAVVADAYRNRSVAEQNSIELAWNLLLEPSYKELRDSIFLSRAEMTNFRRLVVTAVMATDVADKELAALRKSRAAEALHASRDLLSVNAVKFKDSLSIGIVEDNSDMNLARCKATFVVETLMQAADISHTMGSFEMYSKWNKKLFNEMYTAYLNGRGEKDPSHTWYQGEIDFFDHYIIPLARNLSECGINIEASKKFVENAKENRRLWEVEGEALVERYIARRQSESLKNSQILLLRQMTFDTLSESEDSFASASHPEIDESWKEPFDRHSKPKGGESIDIMQHKAKSRRQQGRT